MVSSGLAVRHDLAARHGMSGAHMGAWRHHRDVGCEHDDEARRRGARPRRSHQDGDGRAGREHAADDGPGGVHQATWRAEREDEKRGPLGIRAVDGRHHELGRHRVDDAVHFRRIDQRRCRIGRSRGHRAGYDGQHDANGRQPTPDDAQAHPGKARKPPGRSRESIGCTLSQPFVPVHAGQARVSGPVRDAVMLRVVWSGPHEPATRIDADETRIRRDSRWAATFGACRIPAPPARAADAVQFGLETFSFHDLPPAGDPRLVPTIVKNMVEIGRRASARSCPATSSRTPSYTTGWRVQSRRAPGFQQGARGGAAMAPHGAPGLLPRGAQAVRRRGAEDPSLQRQLQRDLHRPGA